MPQDRPQFLERNLAALARSQPQMYRRLCLPVEGGHFGCEQAERWVYRWRGAPFEASVAQDVALKLVGRAAPEGTGLLFGVGVGELVNAALTQQPERQWIAWDRDPWILRTALSVNDWSAALASGHLKLALNADLLDWIEGDYALVEHPFLAEVYSAERLLLRQGLSDRRALVCTGELFVDSLIDALRAEGYSVFPFEARRQADEEQRLVVERFSPGLVASINFIPGLPEFCESQQLDYLCWEIDPALDKPRVTGSTQHTRIFTYREANVAEFTGAGFEHVEYLALAADPERRKPLELTSEDRTRYGAQVSFVGASLVDNARKLQERFLELYDTWRPGARSAASLLLADLAEVQREDFSNYLVPDELDDIARGWRAACLSKGFEDPADIAGEICASEKRLNYIAGLADLGIEVWGDDGWRLTEPHGVRYRGPAKHAAELPRIYNATQVNIDIGRLYQGDIVTMRIFDICACGGFVLAEHSDALAELFDVGVEIESYRTLEELRAKLRYYLEHPDQARSIAERGRAAVLARHRIDARVRHMLSSLPAHVQGRAPVSR